MSRSRARKNRFKYKTLRQLGMVKRERSEPVYSWTERRYQRPNAMRELNTVEVHVMPYSLDANGRVYPGIKTGKMEAKFDRELFHELAHPNPPSVSISSHVIGGDDQIPASWTEGITDVQKAILNGETLFPTIEPQDTSHMEYHLDAMCAVMGVDKRSLIVDVPPSFATSYKESIERVLKSKQPPEECPWPTKMNLAGIWSNPVDTSDLQRSNFEEVRINDLVQKAKDQLMENRRECILKTAEKLDETIEIDDYLLQDNIKVVTSVGDKWNLAEVKKDSPEWVIVMIAMCKNVELIDFLKGHGYNYIHIARTILNPNTQVDMMVDTYYLFDEANDGCLGSFEPTGFSETYWNSSDQARLELSVDFSDITQTGKEVDEFAARVVGDKILTWNMVKRNES